MKVIGLSLFMCLGHSGYSMLRLLLPLPSVSIVKRYLRDLNCNPGISGELIDMLNFKTKHNPHDKFCFLQIDEMALRKGLTYDVKRDCVWGFGEENVKSLQTENIATTALAVMASGIVTRWRQRIGYSFSGGPMKPHSIIDIVK